MVNIFCYGWQSLEKTSRGNFGVVALNEEGKILDIMSGQRSKKKTTQEEQELKALLYALDFTATPLQRKEKHTIYFETAFPVITFYKKLPIYKQNNWKDENNEDLVYIDYLKPLYYYYNKIFHNFQVKKRISDPNYLPQKLAMVMAMEMKKETNEIVKKIKKGKFNLTS